MKRPTVPHIEFSSLADSSAYNQHVLPQAETVYPEGATSPVPQSEAEISPTLSAAHQLIALRGITRRQALAIQEDKNALLSAITIRDSYIDKLHKDHETDLAGKDEVIELLAERAELSDFGGLLNKNAFKAQAAAKIKALRAKGDRRREAKLGLILGFADVDELGILNFKLTESVVDEEVLEPIAKAINHNKRPDDLASNWGGDEYAELLEASTPKQAESHFRRLLKNVNGLTINPAFEGAGNVTVGMSIGYVVIRGDMSYSEAEKCAARAKEYAKEIGKNTIVNYDDIPADWVPSRKVPVS